MIARKQYLFHPTFDRLLQESNADNARTAQAAQAVDAIEQDSDEQLHAASHAQPLHGQGCLCIEPRWPPKVQRITRCSVSKEDFDAEPLHRKLMILQEIDESSIDPIDLDLDAAAVIRMPVVLVVVAFRVGRCLGSIRMA